MSPDGASAAGASPAPTVPNQAGCPVKLGPIFLLSSRIETRRRRRPTQSSSILQTPTSSQYNYYYPTRFVISHLEKSLSQCIRMFSSPSSKCKIWLQSEFEWFSLSSAIKRSKYPFIGVIGKWRREMNSKQLSSCTFDFWGGLQQNWYQSENRSFRSKHHRVSFGGQNPSIFSRIFQRIFWPFATHVTLSYWLRINENKLYNFPS